MKIACTALIALALAPTFAQGASETKPARSSMGSITQIPIKCVDGTKSNSRSNPCAGHGGIDKAVQAAVTEHASGGSNAASKGVLTTSAPPAKR